MPYFDPKDIQTNKKFSAAAYLGIFFFVPLVMCPNSKLGRYCANQGLLVLLAWLALELVVKTLGLIPLVGWIVALAVNLARFAVVAIAIYYAYLTYTTGEARALPFVGGFTLIK